MIQPLHCCRLTRRASTRSTTSMPRIALGLLAAAAGLAFSSSSALAQFTDACADAPSVAEGTYTFDLTSATPGDQPFTPFCAGTRPAEIDQWIRYVPTASGPVAFTTQGLSTGDTVISLHDTFSPEFDCAFAPFQVRACNDDAGGPQSRAVVNAIGGLAILVRISGADNTRPTGSLRIETFEPVPGDVCSSALAAVLGVNTYDITSAIVDSFEGCREFRDLYFTYVPPVRGALSVQTCDQPAEASVAIFANCGGRTLACSAFGECVAGTIVEAGVPITIRIGSDGAAGPQQFTIALDPAGIPANDDCSNAQVVTIGDTDFDNTFADSQGPLVCNGGFLVFESGNDLWYSFTPAQTGIYDVSTQNSSGIANTILSLYDDCFGAPFACNDDARGFLSWIRTPLTGGQSYIIRVSGAGLPNAGTPIDRGVGVLTVRQSIAPSNDACETPTIIGDGNWAYDVFDATVDSQLFGCLPNFISGSNDVWFQYTPETDGPVEARLLPNGSAGTISFFNSCEEPAAAVAGLLFANLQTGERVVRATTVGFANVPLLVRVAATRFNEDNILPLGVGNGEIYVGPPLTSSPANDECANAIAISEGTTPIDLTGSAKECVFLNPDPQDSCAGPTDNDVFFLYTPAASGLVTITIQDGINYPFYDGLVVSVYGGCGGAPLACSLAFGDAPTPTLQLNVQAGTTYTLRVASILAFGFEQVLTGSITIGTGASPCDYDFNQDENVDLNDAQQMAQVFVGLISPEANWLDGDLNGDENADLTDAQQLAVFVVSGVCPL